MYGYPLWVSIEWETKEKTMNLKPLLLTLLLVACSPNNPNPTNNTSYRDTLYSFPKKNNIKSITYLYASQLGKSTLDNGEGGGNPFASALIELLLYDKLSFIDFKFKLINLTLKKSNGFQKPEIWSKEENLNWEFLPISKIEKRVALILVFSDYKNSKINSLQGTKNDLKRIANKLLKVGFEVTTAIDPNNLEFKKILNKFSIDSKESDIAMIYTTGHGFEMDSLTYTIYINGDTSFAIGGI